MNLDSKNEFWKSQENWEKIVKKNSASSKLKNLVWKYKMSFINLMSKKEDLVF